MDNYLNNCKDIFSLFAGGGTVIYIFLIILIFCIIKSKNKYLKNYYLYPAVVILLIIWNPFFMNLAIQKAGLSPQRYVRLYWLLPIGGVIAYACTRVLEQLHEHMKWKKAEALILLTLLLMASGSYMFSPINFSKAFNTYKLPGGVIEVTEMVRTNVVDNGGSIDETRILAPMELSAYIRQYDGHVKLVYGRHPISSVDNILSAAEIDVNALQAEARPRSCNYVVVSSWKTYIGSMEESGYQLIGETCGYAVYKDVLLEK